MNAVKCFWLVALSVEALKILNREWPHWSGVHPASPIIKNRQQIPINKPELDEKKNAVDPDSKIAKFKLTGQISKTITCTFNLI